MPVSMSLFFVVMTALAAAGAVFILSRKYYESELSYQERVYSTEMARLKRTASRAERKAQKAKEDADRLRRRVR